MPIFDSASAKSATKNATLLMAGLAALLAGGTGAAAAERARVSQEAGNVTYWVLPGPRTLDPAVFGTAEQPKSTFERKLQSAKQAAEQGKGPPTVPKLLKQVPILVGAPKKARGTTPNGQYVFKQPTPFSDKARIIDGPGLTERASSFEATFIDKVAEDPPGKPGMTSDDAEFEATFNDPAGNEYRVVLDHVVKPPFPGYNTEGGVMIDSVHHGATGTGSPLMPEVKTHAAFWGVGALFVNGEKHGQRVMHVMTTEVVRDKDYKLVHTGDLPLGADERHIKSQEHHTHLMMPPVKGTKKGPVFSPVPTAFELPNGKKQPFVHIMWEQDEIERL